MKDIYKDIYDVECIFNDDDSEYSGNGFSDDESFNYINSEYDIIAYLNNRIENFIKKERLNFNIVRDRIALLEEFNDQAVKYFFEKDYINSSIRDYLYEYINLGNKFNFDKNKSDIKYDKFKYIISLPFFSKPVNIDYNSINKYKRRFKKLVKGKVFENIFLQIIKKIIILKNFTKNNSFSKKSFLLVGEPGLGKSYFPEVLAEIIDIPFIDINVGHGDTLAFKGSHQSWAKATIGTFTKKLIQKKYKNPIVLFDEVDKGGYTNYVSVKDIISNILDPELIFEDNFLEVEVDINKCIFFLTANDIKKLPNYLIDRCEIHYIPRPDNYEKAEIICDCILPKYLSKHKFNIKVKIDKNEILEIIKKTDIGLRDGKRLVDEIVVNYLIKNISNIKKAKCKKIEITGISKLIDIEKYIVKNKKEKQKVISFI